MLNSEPALVGTTSISNTSSASNLLYLLLLQQPWASVTPLCPFGLELTWAMEPESNPQGNMCRRLPRGSSSPLAAKGRWLHLWARWLRLKIHPAGECDGYLGSQSLVRKGITWSPRQAETAKGSNYSRLIFMTAQNTNPQCSNYSSCGEHSAMGRPRFLQRVTFRALLGQPSPDTQLWIHGQISIAQSPCSRQDSSSQASLLLSTLAVDLCLQPLTPEIWRPDFCHWKGKQPFWRDQSQDEHLQLVIHLFGEAYNTIQPANK